MLVIVLVLFAATPAITSTIKITSNSTITSQSTGRSRTKFSFAQSPPHLRRPYGVRVQLTRSIFTVVDLFFFADGNHVSRVRTVCVPA